MQGLLERRRSGVKPNAVGGSCRPVREADPAFSFGSVPHHRHPPLCRYDISPETYFADGAVAACARVQRLDQAIPAARLHQRLLKVLGQCNAFSPFPRVPNCRIARCPCRSFLRCPRARASSAYHCRTSARSTRVQLRLNGEQTERWQS